MHIFYPNSNNNTLNMSIFLFKKFISRPATKEGLSTILSLSLEYVNQIFHVYIKNNK